MRGPIRITLALAAAAALMPPAVAEDVNASCLRCHVMATLGRRAPTGEVESLSVSPAHFRASEIGGLKCTDCHDATFTRFPHPRKPKLDFAVALARHKPDLKGAPLDEIEAEYNKSIHEKKHPDLFTCFRCHDPHEFKRWKAVTRQSVAERNAVCLKCHASQENYSRVARRRAPNLTTVHAWLPHQEIHRQQVRCLDCHASSAAPARSHLILPKEQALRDCVKCHSGNTVLRDKLYRYERREEMVEVGFANALIVNNAYVIGATRNRLLDALGGLMVAGTALGIGGHLGLRAKATRKAANETEEREP